MNPAPPATQDTRIVEHDSFCREERREDHRHRARALVCSIKRPVNRRANTALVLQYLQLKRAEKRLARPCSCGRVEVANAAVEIRTKRAFKAETVA